jgi:hypothetical protein
MAYTPRRPLPDLSHFDRALELIAEARTLLASDESLYMELTVARYKVLVAQSTAIDDALTAAC